MLVDPGRMILFPAQARRASLVPVSVNDLLTALRGPSGLGPPPGVALAAVTGCEYLPPKKVARADLQALCDRLPALPDDLRDGLVAVNRMRLRWPGGQIQLLAIKALVDALARHVAHPTQDPLLREGLLPLACTSHRGHHVHTCARLTEGSYELVLALDTKRWALPFRLGEYLALAIRCAGAPLWPLLVADAARRELGLPGSFAALEREVAGLLVATSPGVDWHAELAQAVAAREWMRPGRTGKGRPMVDGGAPMSSETIAAHLILGHSVPAGVLNFYRQLDGTAFSWRRDGLFADSRIAGYMDLFWRKESLVAEYLGDIRLNGRPEGQYRVLVHGEYPIFIDLAAMDPYPLYHWNYSERSLHRIRLTFDEYMHRFIRCGAVQRWERLFADGFAADTPEQQDILRAVRTVCLDQEIEGFLAPTARADRRAVAAAL
ncbi:hypothetical protein [Nannocystis radixulma]|uniref:Uncharacterized protein n=1 Tax=Nannocystis radixulma TaxID=2995305 RepID=A0ABT5BQQ0_9BACT|nr:hypothetical protein [Nannocystis radixulma]MDC0675322.1 hypothetical protein [Nannocystis radixulma]